MSIRLRVLTLVVLAVVASTTAATWLTLRQASQQISASHAADVATVDRIARELETYARDHGTWHGVPELVATLTAETGQRIRLVTTHGEVIVDSDHLLGWAARPVPAESVYLEPRPVLQLPDGLSDPAGTVAQILLSYRYQVVFAACLTTHDLPVRMSDWRTGLMRFETAGQIRPGESDTWRDCQDEAFEYNQQPVPTAQFEACLTGGPTDLLCLQDVFARETEYFTPAPVTIYLGAVDESSPSPVAAGPVVVAGGLVALVAAGGALLVTRRVLRPIGALTRAARRLGAGDLTGRVPVTGRDELAVLARTFNRMATSLQRGEVRQRRLVADVAHELRTPLANLRGYLEALQDGVIIPEPEVFASLHEEAILQQRIVDDLQDLALAEAGRLPYHPVPVELGELLETCRVAHQAAADIAEVTLAVSVPEPVAAQVDPDRFRQVLGNLITNALRATPAGGRVRVTAGRAGPAAVITVTDTGTGIAPADLPHVFDRFWRADAARARQTGGSGLGLAISRQIVTDHGGTITVQSRLGAGTAFRITLPAGDGAPPDGTR